MKRIIRTLLLAALLSMIAVPVLASQGGGGVHFGPYSLADEDTITGDLVVFGPVTLGEDSEFNGDLVAFGPVRMEEGALLTGDLVCAGTVMVDGTIEGSVFAAGTISLVENAVVEGDVSAIGRISEDEGALVEGQIEPMDPEDFEFFFDEAPIIQVRRFDILFDFGRALLTVLGLAIFALIIGSIWPTQMQRVGQTLVDEPMASFGMGALALFLGFVLALVLFITICLFPLGMLTVAVVSIGVALGWISLGYVVGERLLRDLFHAETRSPATAALLGTTLLTLLMVTLRVVSGCLHTLLVLPLFALVGGAVTLTRFGTMPYAAHSGPTTPPKTPASLAPRAPESPQSPPPVDAPSPVAPAPPTPPPPPADAASTDEEDEA